MSNQDLATNNEGESNQIKAHDSSARVLGIVRNHGANSDMDVLYDAERSVVEAVDEAGDVVWSKQVESSPIGKALRWISIQIINTKPPSQQQTECT